MAKAVSSDPCEFCDGHVEHRVIRARFHYKGETIYIDGVPAWVCTHCGEQYFDAPVYKHMEEIARHSDRITRTVAFPLAEYDKASV
jgi:YgiT-type zinc finger domain-containing protein